MVLTDFDIEKLPPLFSYLLTKSESDLYLFALVIPSRDYWSGRFIGSQLVLSVHWFQVVLVGSLRVLLGESSIEVAG
jgi:predicted membrane protein